MEQKTDERYEIYVKSPFFKTLSGVAFIAIAGMAIYGKIKGLNTDSWFSILVGTAIVGILLRYIIYDWSPFNMKKVTSVENLKDARILKRNLDKNKEKTHEIYDKEKNLYVTSNLPTLGLFQGLVLADILTLPLYW